MGGACSAHHEDEAVGDAGAAGDAASQGKNAMRRKRAGKRAGKRKSTAPPPQGKAAEPAAIAANGALPSPAPAGETPQQATPAPAPVAESEPPTTPDAGAEGDGTTQPPPKRKKRRYSPQREDYAILLGCIDNKLYGLETASPALRDLLAEHGVTPAVLAACRTQYDAAQAAMNERGSCAAAEAGAVVAMDRARHRAEIAYGTFRQTARTAFPDRAESAAIYLGLHLTEAIPEATALFVDDARLVLQAAQHAAIAGGLAAATFDAGRIAAVGEAIDALDDAYKARHQAHAVAVQATRKRNETVRALRRAMRPIALGVSAMLRLNPTVNRPVDW